MNNIQQRIIEIVEKMIERTIEPQDLTLPFEQLQLDSLMALELAVHLEREFGVHLTEEELAKFTNLKDILDIVNDK
ncbi:MAG: acyl carrier protein [Bacillota bacterium]